MLKENLLHTCFLILISSDRQWKIFFTSQKVDLNCFCANAAYVFNYYMFSHPELLTIVSYIVPSKERGTAVYFERRERGCLAHRWATVEGEQEQDHRIWNTSEIGTCNAMWGLYICATTLHGHCSFYLPWNAMETSTLFRKKRSILVVFMPKL